MATVDFEAGLCPMWRERNIKTKLQISTRRWNKRNVGSSRALSPHSIRSPIFWLSLINTNLF